MIGLRELQIEVGRWANREFPGWQDWETVVGMQEELGELADAFLKRKQGIRHSEQDALAMEKDAIGDLVIFLLNHCYRQGFDVEQIIRRTWGEVSKRTWRAHHG